MADPLSGETPLSPGQSNQQKLHDAMLAVRSRGAYYGGAPIAPGPAIETMPELPPIAGPRPAAVRTPANENLRFNKFEKFRILNKLINSLIDSFQ